MNKGFFEKLKKPIFSLAPMANVTDVAFREVIAQCGKPDIFWTEFVSCEGLCSEGRSALFIDLAYTERQRPIIAQIFGSRPETFYESAKILREMKFDGIDINMGCPDRAIERQSAGAALMRNPPLAREIIRATQEGAGDLPVSVKTRIGYHHITLEDWLDVLLSESPAAITLHLRTRAEMSKVPAHWDVVSYAVEMAKGSGTLIFGNGDVRDLCEAHDKVDRYGVDGIMLGRSVFGNPWLFNSSRRYSEIPLAERLDKLVEHAKLFETMLGKYKSFAIMKKHCTSYVGSFRGAKKLRLALMDASSAHEMEEIIQTFCNDVHTEC